MMKNISRPVKNLAVGLGVVGMLALGGSLPAFAASNATFTITGTPATEAATSFAAFTGSTTLNGSPLPLASSLTIGTVTDNDGVGHGWTVVLNLSAFVNTNQTLASGSLTATSKSTVAPTAPAVTTGVTALDGSTTAVPLDTGANITIASASTGNGMGTFSFSAVTVGLTVPALAHAGAYTATGTTTFTAAA